MRLGLLSGFHQVNGLASQRISQADHGSSRCFIDIIPTLLVKLNHAQCYAGYFAELLLGKPACFTDSFESCRLCIHCCCNDTVCHFDELADVCFMQDIEGLDFGDRQTAADKIRKAQT